MFKIRNLIAIGAVCLVSSFGYARDHLIEMGSDDIGRPTFDPDYLLIQPGDVVVWVNVDEDIAHNVVADPFGVPKSSELFESPLLDPSEKWSHRFQHPGTYDYHCHPHSDEGMIARIVVGRESLKDELRTETGSGHMHHHH